MFIANLLPNTEKLNSRGIAHFFLPIAVVVLVGVVGTYLLVGSHAMQPRDAGYTRSERAIQSTPAGTRQRIVQLAKQQLNYKEKPVNKVKFFQWVGDTPTKVGPWCSVFTTWVWHAAGVRDESGGAYPMREAVADVRDDGKAHGRFHKTRPQAGDAILYGPAGGDHIGIVEKASGNSVTVIEGNASYVANDTKNQKYVVRRHINIKKPNPKKIPHGVVYGFVSPPQGRQ